MLTLTQMDPGHARAAQRAATCHMRLGDFPAALAVLESAASASPSAEISAHLKEMVAMQAAYNQVSELCVVMCNG